MKPGRAQAIAFFRLILAEADATEREAERDRTAIETTGHELPKDNEVDQQKEAA